MTILMSGDRRLARRPLIPIRPRVGAELSATLATHTRSQRRHSNIIAKVIDVQDSPRAGR
jgi:hypothetical protein